MEPLDLGQGGRDQMVLHAGRAVRRLGQARLQTEADYGIPKGLKLKDEYSRAFQIACAQWRSFAPLLERTDFDAQHATVTFVTELLRDAFGYVFVGAVTGIELGERIYPITHLASAPHQPLHPQHTVPIVVAPHTLGLDEADTRFAIPAVVAAKKPLSSWPRNCSTPARTTSGRW